MKTIKVLKYSFLICLFYFNEAYANCIKTVVFLRHGEKNPVAAGLINCQGENRALGLADPNGNLLSTYGTPAAIYAANPNVTYPDKGCYPNGCCLYHRPYLTISPTAIQLQVPINTNYGAGYLGDISTTNGPVIDCSSVPYPDIEYLKLPIPPSPPNICGSGNTNGDADLARDILKNNNYCGKTIFVAWEHNNIPVVTY